MTADPDTEWLNHLEYFMSKTDKLKQYYRRFPETVVTAFVYRKPNIGHDLLLRMADAPYQEITVRPAETYHLKKMAISRAEVLMLFLNMHPAFEDDREIMPDSVLDDIIIRTFYPETDIGMTDLISLLCCSKTFRLKDDDLLRWTEAYFDELFVNERKEEE